MNVSVKNIGLPGEIFSVNKANFLSLALQIFHFQYENNPVYRQYCNLIKTDVNTIRSLPAIPFLPIQFFKTHPVKTTQFDTGIIFESSGTTQTINSRHYIKDAGLYQKSFTEGFRLFYGDVKEWCIIALLPSYLERKNSSLVMMANELIQQSAHPQSGFYLHELDKLKITLSELERQQQKTMLIGVTFALLDLAEQYPMQLNNTILMETGGMKGRREEITRQQVHEILCKQFSKQHIHSEYGMTELLSQAYSAGDGLFNCPPWMNVLLREEDDPFAIQKTAVHKSIGGAINIIDLANIYSCSFIATEDAGKLHPDGSFEVLGRLDNTDMRGCSLLAL